jgi:hypothetical protein
MMHLLPNDRIAGPALALVLAIIALVLLLVSSCGSC